MIRRTITGHPRASVATLLIAVLVVIIGVWHYWTLYTSLQNARTDLLQLRADIEDAGFSASTGDLLLAQERVDSSNQNVKTARTHFDRDPFLQVARRLPVVGEQLDTADDLIAIGALVTELSNAILVVGQHAATIREESPPGDSPAVVLVQALQESQGSLDEINRLSSALVARRMEVGDRPLIAPLDRARTQLDSELPKLVDAADRLSLAAGTLPGFLGFEGERRYLVVALNNGEILPGGGLVTAAGVVSLNNGENGPVELTDATRWMLDWDNAGGDYIPPPGPLKRYLLRDFTWNLSTSNWSPDFPTWGRQALEFYELAYGPQDVDGVIAVDLVVLERLLALTGPVTLDVPGHGQVTFDSKNAILELERVTRRPSEPGEDRKSAVGDLSAAVLERLHQLPSDQWGQFVNLMQDLAAERHMQLLSLDPEEQKAIHSAGLDGALSREPGDFVSVNEASVLGTKLALILDRQTDHSIELADGVAHHTLRLHYRNPLDQWAQGRDEGLVEDLMGNGVYGAYVRVFVPVSASGFSAEVNGQLSGYEDVGTEAGRQWVGLMLPIRSGQEADIVFRWSVPLDSVAKDGRYELRTQKQAGLLELCTRFHVTAAGSPTPITVNGTPARADPLCLRRDATLTAPLP